MRKHFGAIGALYSTSAGGLDGNENGGVHVLHSYLYDIS